jgi:hypothetical protein
MSSRTSSIYTPTHVHAKSQFLSVPDTRWDWIRFQFRACIYSLLRIYWSQKLLYGSVHIPIGECVCFVFFYIFRISCPATGRDSTPPSPQPPESQNEPGVYPPRGFDMNVGPCLPQAIESLRPPLQPQAQALRHWQGNRTETGRRQSGECSSVSGREGFNLCRVDAVLV